MSCFWRNVSLRHLQSPANNGAEQLNLLGPSRGGRRISHTVKDGPSRAADRAAMQSYRPGNNAPIFSTNFSDPAELRADWNPVSDDNEWGDFPSCRRPSNVQPSRVGLRLKTLIATDCPHKWSTDYIDRKAKYSYGFFEATMKIADIKGMNNAFWMTTEDHPETGDHFEIDVSEVQYPNYDHIGLQHSLGLSWVAALYLRLR